MTHNTIYIPLGSDCCIATVLNQMGLRKFSLPYDWMMSLTGIYENFTSDFTNFYEDDNYNYKFIHGPPPEYRIERLKNILENHDGKVVLIRKSHLNVNHEQVETGHTNEILDDRLEVEDMKKLNDLLRQKYPNLDFKILLFLTCTRCCFESEEYDNLSVISIWNEVTKIPYHPYESPFDNCIQNYLTNLLEFK